MTYQPDRPPTDWREGRRLRAWDLAAQGWKQQAIAAALGVTQGAVSQWLRRARAEGPTALRHQPPPGRQPRLTADQRAQIPALLARGPEAWRFRGNVWTRNRIALVIQETFGVRYDPSQVAVSCEPCGGVPRNPCAVPGSARRRPLHNGVK